MDAAVVTNTDEQASAVGVGERRDGARQLGSIRDFVLEILLLVLALSYHVLQSANHTVLLVDVVEVLQLLEVVGAQVCPAVVGVAVSLYGQRLLALVE